MTIDMEQLSSVQAKLIYMENALDVLLCDVKSCQRSLKEIWESTQPPGPIPPTIQGEKMLDPSDPAQQAEIFDNLELMTNPPPLRETALKDKVHAIEIKPKGYSLAGPDTSPEKLRLVGEHELRDNIAKNDED